MSNSEWYFVYILANDDTSRTNIGMSNDFNYNLTNRERTTIYTDTDYRLKDFASRLNMLSRTISRGPKWSQCYTQLD
jgi:hypothetical protein